MKKQVTNLGKGLHTDNSPVNQPPGTHRFALNTLPESEEGDHGFASNENSNESCGNITNSYLPIGKVYISGGRTVIFSVSSSLGLSEIGIVDEACDYVVKVNGDLGFKINNQIDAEYRLRRGCEDVIYWVDGKNNRPMYYNFSKEEDFKTAGVFDKSKFSLQNRYKTIPTFDTVEVLNNGGNILPGSVNVGIQYIDSNLNTTEIITTSEIINIYNSELEGDYLDIEGSINSIQDYENFGNTSKSVKITLGNLDTNFLFYRLVFIEATDGTGEVSSVKYSSKLSITNNTFIYTGDNFETLGTETELAFFDTLIESAHSIEQIENRLVLAGIEGVKANFCSLQKYASSIKTDVALKKIFLNTNQPNNNKYPTVKFGDKANLLGSYDGGSSYMPGEIYSFGIVYVINDTILSPVFHISGKNPSVGNDVIFSSGPDIYPMRNENQNQTLEYIDNSSCVNSNYWGVDSEGQNLKGTPIRHHRFPTREQLGINLVNVESSTEVPSEFFQIRLNIIGDIVVPCTAEMVVDGLCTNLQDSLPFQVRVTYEVDGVTDYLTVTIDPADYTLEDPSDPNPPFNTVSIDLSYLSNYYPSNVINIISIEETDDLGNPTVIPTGTTSPKGLNYTTVIEMAEFTSEEKIYSSKVMGPKFSGIILPGEDELGEGYIATGYYIVAMKRGEFDKTILDTAVITPCTTNKKYIANGLIGTELPDETRVSKKYFGIIHPEHKFNNNKYTSFTSIDQQGTFDIVDRKKSKSRYKDVQDGTSYDEDNHVKSDDDGWSLKTITRDNITEFSPVYNNFDKDFNADIGSIFYLDALQSKDVDNNSKSVFNISGDNKIGILELEDDHIGNILGTLPYVYLKKDIADNYPNFMTGEYHKVSINMETASETIVFNGDTYLSPMRYATTSFWDNRIAERLVKKGLWKIILGSLLLVGGIALSFFTGGLGLAVAGYGVQLLASGIKQDVWAKAYQEEYDKGLRETLLDDWVGFEYLYTGRQHNGYDITTPQDDEIQWIGEGITDLWFESQINMSLRYGMTSNDNTFMNAPGRIESGRESIEETGRDKKGTRRVSYVRDETLPPVSILDKHIMSKLVVFDSERDDARAYVGHCLGEYYMYNPDYQRCNDQKVFFHLPLEYDCCSDCQEDFPLRVTASEQSFQEELSDNYRRFLPNNYRDIEGDHGKITDLLRWRDNLYVFTEEALWMLPAQYQERVTDEIVSFIGTGDIFSLPPRKILDGNHITAGTRHKWATIREEHGFFFVSEYSRKIYMFNGSELKDLTVGNSKWFKNKGGISLLEQFYGIGGYDFEYANNPSNPNGAGYISTYDSYHNRIILTKKDLTINEELITSEDFRVCLVNGTPVLFNDYQDTITRREEEGWIFVGLNGDCTLVFKRYTLDPQQEVRTIWDGVNFTDYLEDVNVCIIEEEYEYGKSQRNFFTGETSWTMSYYLKGGYWVGWHSYLPNFYYHINESFYSLIGYNNNIWKHNIPGMYQRFYGQLYDHIIEYVSLSQPLQTRLWDDITLHTEAKRLVADTDEFVDVDETFSKAIFYNTKQCTGELTLFKKNNDNENYLVDQVDNIIFAPGTIVIDRNERNWSINDIRDIRIDYTQPIFRSDNDSLIGLPFTDKILNVSTLDLNKHWTELESMRDKYLVIRLIFNTFDDVKLITNYSIENENESHR